MVRAARARADSTLGALERWWVDRYQLPPNDPRFTGQSIAELLEAFLADQLAERQRLQEQREGAPTELRSKLDAAIRAIDGMVQEQPSDPSPQGDPLTAYWESQLEAGLEPDLNMTMEDLQRVRTQ